MAEIVEMREPIAPISNTTLAISPLNAEVPEGFVPPICQAQDCGESAKFLVRGKPTLAVCVQHLADAVEELSS